MTFGIGGKSQDKEGVVEGWGYYETIAGGAGAGPGWIGASGVHTHMTNTRITDGESRFLLRTLLTIVFERRYPVILREFSLRPGSGGKGKYPGGQVSILSERRVYRPYGLHGGDDAESVSFHSFANF